MIKEFPFNPYQMNTYVVYDETKECVIIDPGMQVKREEQMFADFIKDEGLVPRHILLTHPHIDHICGAVFACEHFGLPLTMHTDAAKILKRLPAQATLLNFAITGLENIPKEYIHPGEVITYGNSTLETIDTAGHSNGSLSFISHSEQAVFTGDVLFRQSIGRTDFFDGDLDLLLENIKTKILTLPAEYKVFPGHGPASTVGYEARTNPFLDLPNKWL